MWLPSSRFIRDMYVCVYNSLACRSPRPWITGLRPHILNTCTVGTLIYTIVPALNVDRIGRSVITVQDTTTVELNAYFLPTSDKTEGGAKNKSSCVKATFIGSTVAEAYGTQWVAKADKKNKGTASNCSSRKKLSPHAHPQLFRRLIIHPTPIKEVHRL